MPQSSFEQTAHNQLRKAAPARESGPPLSSPARFALMILVAGLVLAFLKRWLRQVYVLSNVTFTGRFDVGYDIEGQLPGWFRFLVYATFFSFAVVGVLALPRIFRNKLPIVYSVAYVGIWVYAVFLLGAVSKDPLPYLTTMSGLMSKMAPGTILVLSLFFLAADERAWPYIRKYLVWTAILAVGISLVGYFQMGHVSRFLAMRWIWAPALVLEILAILPFGVASDRAILARAFSLVPILTLIISGLLQQTRLVFVSLFLQLAVYSWLRARARTGGVGAGLRLVFGFGVIVLIAAIAVPYIASLGGESLLVKSAQAFMGRLDVDSRTGQIAPFMSIFWEVFPVGLGYPAPGQSNGESGAGQIGIDSGYLNTMYVVGVPMMLGYFLMLVLPVLRALGLKGLAAADAAAVAGAAAYCVRMTSSSVPSLDIDFVIYVLLVGRCASLLRADKVWAEAERGLSAHMALGGIKR